MPGAFAGFNFGQQASPAYGLETLTTASLCVFSKHEFREAARRDALLLDALAGTLGQQRDRLMVRIDLMGRGAARQRVAFLLIDLFDQALSYSPRCVDGNHFYLPLTQNDLADACGLTNVRLKHVQRALQRDGIIKYQGKAFEFVDRPELERIAGMS
jgi:CRP-like cAMP-binding protein